MPIWQKIEFGKLSTRVAAVYNISIRELLTVSASLWDLCVMPSGELLASLCEITRLSSAVIRQLTISGSGIGQAWWNIRQIAPDVLFPNVEYEYRPLFKFCRLCLWDDLVSQRDQFIRAEWMLAIPTICLVHGVPIEEVCEACQAREFPIFASSRRGFRLVCGYCKTGTCKTRIRWQMWVHSTGEYAASFRICAGTRPKQAVDV